MKVTFTDYIVLALVASAPFNLPIYYYVGVLLVYGALRLAKKENNSF